MRKLRDRFQTALDSKACIKLAQAHVLKIQREKRQRPALPLSYKKLPRKSLGSFMLIFVPTKAVLTTKANLVLTRVVSSLYVPLASNVYPRPTGICLIKRGGIGGLLSGIGYWTPII